MESHPSIGIVVIAKNDEATVLECLDGVAKAVTTVPASTRVVVVDRNSIDRTADVAVRHPVVDSVIVGGSIGVGAALRGASRPCSAPVLAVLGAHLRPQDGWLEAALNAFPDGPGPRLPGPVIVWGPDGSLANFAIDREQLESVDLFDGAARREQVEERLAAVGGLSTIADGMTVAPAPRRSSADRTIAPPVSTPSTAGEARFDGRITVVVCTRDRSDRLPDCVASLGRLDDGDHEIIVVDNHRKPTVARDSLPAAVRVLHEPRRGLDVARNRGMRNATGEIVAYVDDDCVVDPHWLRGLRAAFSDPSVAFVTGRVRALSLELPSERRFEAHFGFDRGTSAQRFTPWDRRPWFPLWTGALGTGCNMAFRRDILRTEGGFDERLDMGTPIGGGGDLDIFMRLLDRGHVAAYEPEALVWHGHRRNGADLRRQFRGYGAATGALLAKSVLDRPGHRQTAMRFMHYRATTLIRAMRRSRHGALPVPVNLLVVELLGLLAGPVLYLTARATTHRR